MVTNLLLQAQQQLREVILNALGQTVAKNTLPAQPIPTFQIEIPADTSHGDFAVNVAMVTAKTYKLPPRKIAQIIQDEIILDGTYFERCEIAGPGFMNFFVSQKWFGDTLKTVHQTGTEYGRSDFGEGKKIVVEFVSANPTGPMHIGNARGGSVGDCLASVLDWAGYQVTREFYVNDAGNQIAKFGLSLSVRYLQEFGQDVPLPADAYQGQDIIEHARKFKEIYQDQYLDCDEETRRKALVDYALPINIANLKKDLEKYRIHYDVWFLESELHNNQQVQNCIALLTSRGLTYEQDGTLFYKATEYGGDKDEVLVRANGIPTYFAADIAYHYDKFATRGFDRAINIWGADHHGHVARLKGAMDAIGLDGNKLDIVLMQLVKLMRNGELVKVSKRTGKSITLVDLLEEVPIDAARFFFNLREVNSQMDFDLDLAVEKSSENPVYYVQYAHARICSILSKLSENGVDLFQAGKADFSLLIQPEEKALIRHIALLPNEIIEAAKAYEPAKITRYSILLATLFHKFYNACRVNVEEQNLLLARLGLCQAVQTTLKNVLNILKIEAPDSM